MQRMLNYFSLLVLVAWALVLYVVSADAKYYATPAGLTCEQVRMYYAQLGGMQGVLAYGKANNIQITASQKMQALRCLNMAARRK